MKEFSTSQEYIDKGIAIIDSDSKLAVKYFTKALKLKHDNISAYYNRGKVYDKLEEYQKAVSDLERAYNLSLAVKDYPADKLKKVKKSLCHGYYGMVGIEKNNENYTSGISYLDKIIALGLGDDSTYLLRGMLNNYLEKPSKAILDFTSAIKIKPNSDYAYYHRASSYKKRGDFSKAIKDYTKLIELDPNDADNYYYRGYAKALDNRHQEAIWDLDKALELNAFDFWYYYERGRVENLIDMNEAALKDLNKAIQLEKEHACAYYIRSYVHWNLGNFKQAQQDWEKTIELDPEYGELL